MANNEDVLERAAVLQMRTRFGVYPADVWEARNIIDALAADVRDLRDKLNSEAGHRLSLCVDNERLVADVGELRRDRERAKSEIKRAVELILRWGCECEPQIGFTCGPCRVVEIMDASMGGED